MWLYSNRWEQRLMHRNNQSVSGSSLLLASSHSILPVISLKNNTGNLNCKQYSEDVRLLKYLLPYLALYNPTAQFLQLNKKGSSTSLFS